MTRFMGCLYHLDGSRRFLHAILTHQQENFPIVFELWRIFYCLLSFFTRIKISGELLT